MSLFRLVLELSWLRFRHMVFIGSIYGLPPTGTLTPMFLSMDTSLSDSIQQGLHANASTQVRGASAITGEEHSCSRFRALLLDWVATPCQSVASPHQSKMRPGYTGALPLISQCQKSTVSSVCSAHADFSFDVGSGSSSGLSNR